MHTDPLSRLADGLQALDLSPGACTPPFFPFCPEHANVEQHSLVANKKFYVVFHGKTPGIYTVWENSAENQVNGVSSAKYKSARNWSEALEYWADYCGQHHRHVPPAASPSKAGPLPTKHPKTPPRNHVQAPRPATPPGPAFPTTPFFHSKIHRVVDSGLQLGMPITPARRTPSRTSPTKKSRMYAVEGSPIIYADKNAALQAYHESGASKMIATSSFADIEAFMDDAGLSDGEGGMLPDLE